VLVLNRASPLGGCLAWSVFARQQNNEDEEEKDIQAGNQDGSEEKA
jgi:hypothetical protein